MALPDLKIEITAITVAWYGAIVATASIFLSLYNVLRDRARIKIKFRRRNTGTHTRLIFERGNILENWYGYSPIPIIAPKQ